jgi:hypothetical protein
VSVCTACNGTRQHPDWRDGDSQAWRACAVCSDDYTEEDTADLDESWVDLGGGMCVPLRELMED